MGNLISYVEQLSETIGPRPATTDAEERASHFIRDAFEARGLEPEVQTFDSPRTYSWAFVIYHVLTILAAVGSRFYAWPALVVGALAAIVFHFDLDTRWGLTALMPKGPSQNVVARHVPKSGRNERVAKVVVVAHYDSARASLAFSPGMVKNFETTFALMKASTYAVPWLIALRMVAGMLPFASKLEPWGWYVTLVPAVYLLLPLLIDVHRELFMRYTPGANDNASGVAAMLGVMERLVPEPDAATVVARETAKIRTEEEAWAADVVPEGALLSYSPVNAPALRAESWTEDEDISWDTGVISGQTALGLEPTSGSQTRPAVEPTAARDADAETSMRLFGVTPPASSPASAPARRPAPQVESWSDEIDLNQDTAPFDVSSGSQPPMQSPAASPSPSPDEGSRRRGLFGGGRKGAEADRHGVRDWLGIGDEFEAPKKGREIGSWDHFEDDDDETGWKGGTAVIEGLDDPGFAASEAARIRRRVTMNVDRELVEKEVWFVATGAEEVGTIGMKAFLAEHGPDLRDAVIINLDNIGSGALQYVTREGMAKRYDADRRLVSMARRAVREAELPVKGCEYRGLSTDATAALARGYRAMSVMAFDINGRLPNWHWTTDTVEGVDEANLTGAVDLVAAIIKEL
jgi:hypothetical protein